MFVFDATEVVEFPRGPPPKVVKLRATKVLVIYFQQPSFRDFFTQGRVYIEAKNCTRLKYLPARLEAELQVSLRQTCTTCDAFEALLVN